MNLLPRRLQLGLVPLATAFVVLVCVSTVAVHTVRSVGARTLQLHEGATAATNLARSLAQHATDTLKQSDTVLLGLVDRLEVEGTGPASIARIHPLMMRYVKEMPQLQRISIIDANGAWLSTSLAAPNAAVDVSDRAYFKHHLASNDPGPYLGPPIRSRSTNQWIITLSRRIDRPDGSFAGVALASIDLDHFSRFFNHLDVGNEGALVIGTHDGILIDRRPYRDDIVGTSIAGTPLFRDHVALAKEGVVTLTSTIDGIERQVAFERLDGYPLFVAAALATSETLADWYEDVVAQSAFIALLVGALGFIGVRLIGQIRAGVAMETRLRESRAELETLNEILAVVAREDALTGLANRRELDRVLAVELARAERMRTPLAFIMIDVDLFKNFNDRYGHPAGDDCLRRIGAALATCATRPGDLMARYGGEEFAAVLPGIDADGATAVAERIRNAVKALGIDHDGSPKGIVTLSMGLAVLDLHEKTSPKVLIRYADTALYAAKRNGRDCIDRYRPLLAA